MLLLLSLLSCFSSIPAYAAEDVGTEQLFLSGDEIDDLGRIWAGKMYAKYKRAGFCLDKNDGLTYIIWDGPHSVRFDSYFADAGGDILMRDEQPMFMGMSSFGEVHGCTISGPERYPGGYQKWNITMHIPKFDTLDHLKAYIIDGKTDGCIEKPPGFEFDDEGVLQPVPTEDESLGVPLEFMYFLPGMWGQSVEHAILFGNNLHEFQAKWRNADDKLGYSVQIQYKGDYKAKEGIFSKWRYASSNYVTVAELPMSDKKWACDEMYIDMGVDSPVYKQIKDKLKIKFSPGSMKQTAGYLRIRYVKYKGDKIASYGRWVQNAITEDGSFSVVTDEDGNPVDTPEYGDGKDNAGQDVDLPTDASFSSIIDSIANIKKLVGQVPSLLADLMGFMPPEVWALIAAGIALMIAIAVIKAIRG